MSKTNDSAAVVHGGGAGASVPRGRIGGWRAATVVESVPVGESLTSPPLVLDSRLEVGNDGDDVFFKEGGQAECHSVDLEQRQVQDRCQAQLMMDQGQTFEGAAPPGTSCWACRL